MHSFARPQPWTWLPALILMLSCPSIGSSQSISRLTDFQRMSWLFYDANRDSIPADEAAVHFGILHSRITHDSHECQALGHLSDDKAVNVIEQFRNSFDSLQLSVKPENISDRFSTIVTMSNAYSYFNDADQSLVLGEFNQWLTIKSVDAYAMTEHNYRDHPPCTLWANVRNRTEEGSAAQMPSQYQIDTHAALQKAIMPTNLLSTLPDIRNAQWLRRVQINKLFANRLISRPSIDQIMDVKIDYRFLARRPFKETDAYGRRNQFVWARGILIGLSLPTHAVEIDTISYIDKRSGVTLKTISFEQDVSRSETNGADRPRYNKSPGYYPLAKIAQNGNLPLGLRTHRNALVVRADDLVFHKTPASNRMALTRLNQLLALSAGLPDLSVAENGIYVADLLGDDAQDYFQIEDMKAVQPQTYNLLLDGADQGLSVATKWRDDVPREQLLDDFRVKEIPALRAMTVKFPIEFLELREVLVQPYDSDLRGFPLMLVNGSMKMRLNDLRKPTIRLDAELPGLMPLRWELGVAMAELFIERYYRFHDNKESHDFLTRLKRLTLASRYAMTSVSAKNGTVHADMKLLQRALYLDDELKLKIAELPAIPK